MVSFELGREIEKDFFVLPRAWGKGKMRNRTSELPIPRRTSERGIRRSEIRFLMENQNFFLFPTLATRRKTSSSKYSYLEEIRCLGDPGLLISS